MFKVPNSACQSLMIVLLLLVGFVGFEVTAQAQNPSPSPAPRRALPKPPAGARGFEKYAGGDSSQRGGAAGATRATVNPRRPVAPLEGRAYIARPLFVWEVAPGSKTYHFVLYLGDIYKDKAAPVLYETNVTTSELQYPESAPRLEPGKIYSWGVTTPTASGKDEDGAIVVFDILTGKEAAEVKEALAKAGLASPKTAADRLDQAKVFDNYGIWYDALRVASALVQDPNNKDALAYYDELLEKLDAKPE